MCNLASVLINTLVSMLLNRRAKGSLPTPEKNGLGQLMSLQTNFLILQVKVQFSVLLSRNLSTNALPKKPTGTQALELFSRFPVTGGI